MPKSDFQVWMAKVDAALERKVGLSSLDLSDCCYHDWFDDGITPMQAARLALAENF